MQGIKVITFDATNTLLKFRIPPWQYYGVVAREHGFTGTGADLKHRMLESFKFMQEEHPNFGRSGLTWRTWWQQVVKLTFKDQLPPHADIDKIALKLIDEFKTTKCWSVADGARKLLEILKNKGVTIGVISNFDPRLDDILTNVSLHKYFDFILTSYDVGFSKPDSRIFDKALKFYKKPILPSEALHIGDDVQKDYEGARSAGWNSLLVTTTNKNELPPANNHVFTSIEALYIAVHQNTIVF